MPKMSQAYHDSMGEVVRQQEREYRANLAKQAKFSAAFHKRTKKEQAMATKIADKPLKEEHKDDSVRDRSLTVRRTLDAAARSKAAKATLDAAAHSKKGFHVDIASLFSKHQAERAKKHGAKKEPVVAKVKEREHSLKEGVDMNNDFSPIADVVTLVANDQHAEATGIVNDLLSARVLDSLQAHKETIAQSLFVPSADSLQEEVVQEEHESVEDFVKRGGKIKQVAPGKAYGSQKPQTIKKAKQYFVKKG